MTHIELPLKDFSEGKHITLVHFARPLSSEDAAVVVEGMEALGAIYGGFMYDMFYGVREFFGPPRNPVVAATVELGTNALLDLRSRLVDGIRRNAPHVFISADYGEWTPHVTDPPFNFTPWQPIHYHRFLRLIQGPHVIDVPFPDSLPE